MKSITRIHLMSALYCASLIALNWVWSARYSRGEGVTSESVSPVALAFLVSVFVAGYLVFRCTRLAAARLESGNQVQRGRWIQSWSVILYAVPLLFHKMTTSSWIEDDGAYASSTSSYGHGLSSYVFFFAVIGLLLAQIHTRLKLEKEAGRTSRFRERRQVAASGLRHSAPHK